MNTGNKYETFIYSTPLWEIMLAKQKFLREKCNQLDMFEQEWEIPVEQQMFFNLFD